MEKHEFKITINGPREKVWSVLWEDASYREWTSVFTPGSYAKTDWKKGSQVRFLNEKNDGMISRIEENIPNEYMSIEHLGFVKNGVEDKESEEVKKWSGAHENYTLKSVNGKTELVVDMDIVDEYKDYFAETWPKALEKVKELSEEH
ncbi:SRPBCC domain-containing protein [Chitinophaga sp. CF418]|uniref:SRPBCC family protein n=1 Tax=Chitinophaga sp. CF418 TaxID=1855287 RepID=UPI000915B2A3|nr:SRPBCC domain-containing protein [Chitinophaga sp. CF418]SHN15678.1 Activator of Hsp90 ATPase homolog 1-like protein [Chitinophaga sp. CF418]